MTINIYLYSLRIIEANGRIVTHEDPEEFLLPEDRKEGRKARKAASRSDRSKYKKSDQDQLARQKARDKQPPRPGLVKGRVLSVHGLQARVDSEGVTYACTLKGTLKKEVGRLKNLLAVGDIVFFEKMTDNEGSIELIEERYSTLSRADALSRTKEHLIAANIDQVLITSSVVAPSLKPGLIDRYIIAASKGNMEPIIVINKIDLLEDGGYPEQAALVDELVEIYRSLGRKVVMVSADSDTGMDQLRAVMRDRTSVFSGQSGTGKSSLINTVAHLDLPVGEVVAGTRKGAHTTTTARLIALDTGGWCIDTPGIKSFGVWNLDEKEIAEYYTEIWKIGGECRFPDCTHTHEPECAVHAAVESGEIKQLRYNSYLALLESVREDQHRRR